MVATLDYLGRDLLLHMITTELLTLPTPQPLAKLMAAHRTSRALFLGVAQNTLSQRLASLFSELTKIQLGFAAVAGKRTTAGNYYYDSPYVGLPEDAEPEMVELWGKREKLELQVKNWVTFTLRFFKAHGWHSKPLEKLAMEAEMSITRKVRQYIYSSYRSVYFWRRVVKQLTGPGVFLMSLRKRRKVSYKEVDECVVDIGDEEGGEEDE